MESKNPRKDFITIQQRNAIFSKFGKNWDCSFLVGIEPHQKVIRAHRVILAVVSPVFKAMFIGAMAERKYPIPIPDIEHATFRNMLRYIYGIKISKYDITFSSIEDACNVYYAANKYILPRLKSKCTGYIYSRLCRHNKHITKYICPVYEFASLYEEERIKIKCLEIISEKTREIVNDSSFNEVQLSLLVTIFSLEKIACTELDLFNALARYVKAECENKADLTEFEDKAGPTVCEDPLGCDDKGVPIECEDKADFAECIDKAEPTKYEDKAEPTKCGNKADITDCVDKADSAECEDKAEPTECEDKADSAECIDKAEPREYEDKAKPTKYGNKADLTECVDKADFTECEDKAEPTECEDKAEPTECVDKADFTKCEDKAESTEWEDKAEPTECVNKADFAECEDKAEPTECVDKADFTECEDKAEPTECKENADSTKCENKADLFVGTKSGDNAEPQGCSISRDTRAVHVESSAETEPQRQHGDPQTECKTQLNIRPALEQIRFLTLTAEQFVEGPAKSGLLTESEVSAILSNITSDESNVPMPTGFSTCKESRWDPLDRMIQESFTSLFPILMPHQWCDHLHTTRRYKSYSYSDDDDYYISSDEF